MGLVEALQNQDKKNSTDIEVHYSEMKKAPYQLSLVSGVDGYGYVITGERHTHLSLSSNTFINSERSFYAKFQPLADYFEEQGLTFGFVRDKFNYCLSNVLELEVNLKAFEITKDLSVIFTFLANGKKVYFEYFFDYDANDFEDDEVIFTLDIGGGQLKSFGGTLESSLRNLQGAITFSNQTATAIF